MLATWLRDGMGVTSLGLAPRSCPTASVGACARRWQCCGAPPVAHLVPVAQHCQPRGGARTCACERCETPSAPAPAPCRVPRRRCSRVQKAPLTLSWYPSQRRPASTCFWHTLHRTVGAASLESHFYSGRANVPRLSLYRAQLDVESRVWECQVRIASCSKYTRPRPDSVHKDTPDQHRMDIKTPPTSPWRSGRAAWAHRRRESCSRRFDAGPKKTEIAFRGVWYKSEMPQTLPRPAQTHPWPSARAPTDRGTWGFGEGW